MASSPRWIRTLSSDSLAEIDAAARRSRGVPWRELSADHFPLSSLRGELAEIADELEDGCGMVKLRGLPVARYDEEELRRIWFGLGCHLGRPVFQNRRGELMRDIRDEGSGVGDRYGQICVADRGKDAGGETSGVFLSSYARTLSNGSLRFHTDRTDVVGLLCVRQAGTGGISRLCSSVAIHNEMLRRRPDLLDVLFEPYHRSRFGEEATAPEEVYALPIFGLRDGKFTSHYSLTFIEAAQKVAGVPRLIQAQRQALDMLMALAEELSFDMTLEPGDMQFLNNHVIYHARTAFTDDDATGRRRLLYRLWLSMPNSRALPADHAVLWGRVEAGAPRGGIGQVAPQ
ncbi:MAG: TauD/TfdA family dioxygenase [Alphaproteobacteria bacterium]|nr:TauD/TfdA family dioxygenase [Alphaproteobacteria bacterium]